MAETLPEGWSGDRSKIRRTFRFPSFRAAMAFMAEVAEACEAADHHPDWRNVFDRVEVELTTRDAGRVTAKDVALAETMNAIFERPSDPTS